jgi:DNA-binding response OmpR family regulator
MAKKILVVDDEIESLKLIGLMLQRRGYEIVAARSGAQALERAMTGRPDLAILDVMMPDMDGYEVCRRLRADPATAGMAIIMFTSKTLVDDKVAGFQAGADDYLTKPVHPEELASRIETVLLRTAHRRVEETSPARAKIIGFLGAKGGVGTTTLAVNVAAALVQMQGDRQVILADIQSGMAASSVQLALRRHGGLGRLLDQPVEQMDARTVEAQLEEHKTGVRVLGGQLEPLGTARPLLPSQAETIVQHLGAMADYLLLDCGVGLNETNCRILPGCDHIVVAIEPHRVALTLAELLLNEMTSALTLPRHKISVVLINKAPCASTFTKEAIEGLLQHDLAGVITPAPELAFQAAETGNPMVVVQPTSMVAQQLRNIAEYLVGI